MNLKKKIDGYIGLIIGSLVFALLLFISDIFNLFAMTKVAYYVSYCSFGLIIITALLARKFPKLKYTVPFFIQVAITAASSQDSVILTSLYALPVVYSLYYKNRKFSFIVLVVNIICYITGVFIRVYLFNPANVSKFYLPAFPYCAEIIMISLALFNYVDIIGDKVNKLDELNREMAKAQGETMDFCIDALSYHSHYLRIHTKNVAKYTSLILNQLKDKEHLSDKYIMDVIFGAYAHDMGKINISDSVLDKPGRLSDEEFNEIKNHVTYGDVLFAKIPDIALDAETKRVCGNCIKCHHERLDGSGYMNGISEIPFEAQIIAVADTLDALLSYRSYKKPIAFDEAIAIIRADKGYNQKIVDEVIPMRDKIEKIAFESNEYLKVYIFGENKFSNTIES